MRQRRIDLALLVILGLLVLLCAVPALSADESVAAEKKAEETEKKNAGESKPGEAEDLAATTDEGECEPKQEFATLEDIFAFAGVWSAFAAPPTDEATAAEETVVRWVEVAPTDPARKTAARSDEAAKTD